MYVIVTGPHTTGPKAPAIRPPDISHLPKTEDVIVKWLSTTSVVVKAYQDQPDNYEQLVEHYITWEVTRA